VTDISEVSYREPDRSLFDRLLPVARKIFTDTFSHLYDRPEFERFCDRVYGSGGSMAADFNVPSVHWRVASIGDRPIGYAKLTPLRAAAISPEPNALELQQLYVAREWHGIGVAEHLMKWALTTARSDGAAEVYLTVFDHNERAKRFYSRFGFEEVGRCAFELGNRIDDDRIWRLRL